MGLGSNRIWLIVDTIEDDDDEQIISKLKYYYDYYKKLKNK